MTYDPRTETGIPTEPVGSLPGRSSCRTPTPATTRAADDCGFSAFSIDEKPNHGSPDYARDVAFQKIANRVEGTRAAAETLHIG